jgi:subfamily B ATP-binding cassette protein MsbA
VSLVLLFITSWELTLVMMGIVPALVAVAVFYGRMTKKLTKDYQDALAKAAGRLSELLSIHL